MFYFTCNYGLSRPFVHLSVCPSVHGVDVRESWVSFKVITRLIGSGSSLLGTPTPAIYSPTGTHQNSGGIRVVAVLSRKPAISLKRGKIGPRLLLILVGNCIRTFYWYQNQWPRMTLNGQYAFDPLHKTCVFRRPPRTFEYRPILSAAKM